MEGFDAEEERVAAWRAAGGGAMGIGEIDPFPCEPVHVWGHGLRVSAEEAGPIVHVVDGDEENVRRLLIGAACRSEKQEGC